MRVETVENKFNPISIVLETPEEVAKFYAILNHPTIVNSLKIDRESDEIRASISDVMPDAYKISKKWYQELDAKILSKM